MRIEWDYVLSNAGHERCSVCVSWLFSFKRPSLIILQSGLAFESESESLSVLSDSLWPNGLYSPWNSPGQNTGVGSLSLLQGIFPTQDQTQFSHIAGRFFTSWATRKPKNTGVGSLSLLQGIFPTQESNRSLLHCRRILYQLSYQGSPGKTIGKVNLWHIPKGTHH